MHRRDLRGLISRPTVEETQRYRASIDSHIDDLLSDADEKLLDEIEPILDSGHSSRTTTSGTARHRHQTRLRAKSALSRFSANARSTPAPAKRLPIAFHRIRRGDHVEIGHDGPGFSYDNEGPRHRALVPAFSLASRPVTNGEYIAFIEDNGYARSEFWLSLGWMTVNEQRWQAPLYWTKRDGAWWNFTLSGLRAVDESEPVTHVSYFEADAFANWSGARLPTEFEWERAARRSSDRRKFRRERTFHPRPLPAAGETDIFTKCSATFGNGRAAPIRLTPVIAPRPARSANTTASSCATNTSCAAAPAPRRARHIRRLIAISFNRKNAGSSPASDSPAIRNDSAASGARSNANDRNLELHASPRQSDFSRKSLPGFPASRARCRANISTTSAARSCSKRSASCRNITSPALRSTFCDRNRAEIASQLGRKHRVDRSRHRRRHKDSYSLESARSPTVYIPVDISEKQLRESSACFRKFSPTSKFCPSAPITCNLFMLPSPRRKAARNIVYFPGSTIGNFEPTEAMQFLRRELRNGLSEGGGLLIGVDLQKGPECARSRLQRQRWRDCAIQFEFA